MRMNAQNSSNNNNEKYSNKKTPHVRCVCIVMKAWEWSVSVWLHHLEAVSSFFMHFADTEQLTAFDHLVHFLKEQNTFPNRPASAVGLTFTLQP